MVTECNIRPYNDRDAESILALANQNSNVTISMKQFLSNENYVKTYPHFHRLVLEVNGKVIGDAHLTSLPGGLPTGYMWSNGVRIDSAYRGNGYGNMLAAALERLIEQHQPAGVLIPIPEDNITSRDWALRRGFHMKDHQFESILTVKPPFKYEPCLQSKIRITTMNEQSDWGRFYRLYADLCLDTPDMQGAEPLSLEYVANLFENDSTISPEEIFLATLQHEWVGVCILRKLNDTAMSNFFTGVNQLYRGNGIGLSLLSEAIRYATSKGITVIRSNSYASNTPMLKITRKLGFERNPGRWIMERTY